MKQGEERAGKGTVFRDGPVARENLAEEVTLETQTSEGGALSLPGAGSVQRSHGPVFPGVFTLLFPFNLTSEGGLLVPQETIYYTLLLYSFWVFERAA